MSDSLEKIDISNLFGNRIQIFQDEIGFQGKEAHRQAANAAGITYTRYMEWRRSDVLIAKPQDVCSFVIKSCEVFSRSDILNKLPEVISWLCFGVEQLNPFVQPSNTDDSVNYLFVTEILNLYDNILEERNLDRVKITKERKKLAIRKLMESIHRADNGKYSVKNSDREFVGDILNL